MPRTARNRRKRRPRKAPGLPQPDLRRLRLRLQGWFLRTLRAEATGEYLKAKRALEFFLMHGEQRLGVPLRGRDTDVAVDEALSYLSLRWGPRFRKPLHLDARITDTHLKFSITVPVDGLAKPRSRTLKEKQRRQMAADRALYVVRRLNDRLQLGPAGRQLVFLRLLPQSPHLQR